MLASLVEVTQSTVISPSAGTLEGAVTSLASIALLAQEMAVVPSNASLSDSDIVTALDLLVLVEPEDIFYLTAYQTVGAPQALPPPAPAAAA